MKQIWTTILAIFSIVTFLFLLLYAIGAANDTGVAASYLQQCAAELQVCNYDTNVQTQIIQEAAENGYELRIEVIKNEYNDALYAVLELDYAYSIPMIGLESKHTKTIISK